jgi:hypothetical protein
LSQPRYRNAPENPNAFPRKKLRDVETQRDRSAGRILTMLTAKVFLFLPLPFFRQRAVQTGAKNARIFFGPLLSCRKEFATFQERKNSAQKTNAGVWQDSC